jgi:type I restriction enzyme S subunit
MRPYLRVANVLEDRIDTTDLLSMNFTPEEYEVYSLRPGDVLLNDGQSPELVGRPAMYRGEVPGACYQNHIIRFRTAGLVEPEFALLVFRSYLHTGKFRSVARWTTNIATLSAKRFSAMPFPLPPLHVQQLIVAETRRRLDASAEQEAAVRASLARLPDFEREMLSTAISGTLVDSTAYEESASDLLARLGAPPKELRPLRASNEEEAITGMMSSHADDRREGAGLLADVVAGAGRPLTLQELLLLAGFDKDSGADVERFYLVLREELGRSIQVVENLDENAIVDVMRDAAH